MVVKVKLNFRLISATENAGFHLLTLNLKNVGSSILKNLVVKLNSPDLSFPVDSAGCFIYALMPDAYQNLKFRVISSLARVYFSVYGYASGDAYFSVESPELPVPTRQSIRHTKLLA